MENGLNYKNTKTPKILERFEINQTPKIVEEYGHFAREAFDYFMEEKVDIQSKDNSYLLHKTNPAAVNEIIETVKKDEQKWKVIQKIISREKISQANKNLSQKLRGNSHIYKSRESIELKLNRKGEKFNPWKIADYARICILTKSEFVVNPENVLSTIFKPFLQEIKNKNGSTIGYEWKMLPKEIDITYNDTGYTDIQMHVCPPQQMFEEFFNYFSRKYGVLKSEKEKYKKWYNGDLTEKIDPLRFEVQIMPEQMLLLKTIEEPYYQTRKIIQDCLGKIGNIANPKLEFSKAGEVNLEEYIKNAVQQNNKNWEDKIVEFFNNPGGKNGYYNKNYIGNKFTNLFKIRIRT